VKKSALSNSKSRVKVVPSAMPERPDNSSDKWGAGPAVVTRADGTVKYDGLSPIEAEPKETPKKAD
jgi:hypothetical protein